MNQLTSVTIPDSVTSLGAGAFAGNPLTYVYVPDNLTSREGSISLGGTYDPGVPALSRGTFAAGSKTYFIPMLLFGELTTSQYEEGFSISLPANIRYQGNSFFTMFLLSSVLEVDPLGSFYNKNGKKAGTYTWDGKKWHYTAKR
jgi:hypothetical protein